MSLAGEHQAEHWSPRARETQSETTPNPRYPHPGVMLPPPGLNASGVGEGQLNK